MYLSNTKARKLFSIESIQRFLKTGIIWTALLILIPQQGWSQVPADSVKSSYDSLQDARTERLEWRTGRQLEQLERARELSQSALDSMELMIGNLRQQAVDREVESQVLSEKLSLLGEELERTSESSRRYRKQLHQTLWITGSVLLALLVASFLIVFLYGVNTRHLLKRFRWKQKQVRKQLSAEISSQEELFLDALSQQYLQVKGELKTHRKKLRKEIPKIIQKMKIRKRK